ncbi:GNAT family N-acetyltransferase [Pseudaminobacter sp. 19-2017]|uniref:GNAT family N-acetyltransferase n=1 Tax=Pseudaminobacter soli (ex Zhang et al. 2022) TaxID=2831468 RepID=A0A942E418_9HYPH|nr:GNAT family N-acetyltransferase [Pseudaminobacter soli]
MRDFILTGREHNKMGAFLALLDDQIVGSAACEVQRLPYPDVTIPSFRKFGYIWSVYVVPFARGQGIA